MGKTFEKISNSLPFVHAIELSWDVLIGDYSIFNEHFWWTIGYAVLSLIIAILALRKKGGVTNII